MVLPNSGIGQMWFGGVDISKAPYYAGITTSTKYWMLDGFTSTQFTTSPRTLVSSRPYAKDWVLGVVLRSIAPDNSRETLMRSLTALNALFDPTNGPQQLVLAEFPGSYWIAVNESSTLDNEDATYQMFEADINFACTGPAYSVTESDILRTINTTQSIVTITSNGDTPAWPRWRIYWGGQSGIKTTYTITNTTTGEEISWTGALNFGDYIDFIMDAEYGTPYTVLINGEKQGLSGCSGPSWPHLAPGENVIEIKQPLNNPLLLGVTWRDRFNVGQQIAPIQVTAATPTALPSKTVLKAKDAAGYTTGASGSYVFSGQVVDILKLPIISVEVSLLSTTDEKTWTLVGTATTAADGTFTFPATTPTTSTATITYRAFYSGGAGYGPSYSYNIPTLPPSDRTVMTMTTSYSYAEPFLTVTGQMHPPYSGTPVYLEITPPNGFWTDVTKNPGMADGPTPVSTSTDANGNFTFVYQVPPTLPTTPQTSTQSYNFMALYAGDLATKAVHSTTAYTLTSNSTPWPAQLPGPITYAIGIDPLEVTNGHLQYYAACGFTTAIMVSGPTAAG